MHPTALFLPLPPAWARWLLAAAALALAGGCAQPPRGPAAPPPGIVSVTHADLAGATPASQAGLNALCIHLAERLAPVLREGERAQVHVTHVRRATAAAAPQIDLAFTLRGADARVLRQGSRQLRGAASPLPQRYAGDALGHEKTLIDDWVAQEFAPR